MLKIAEWPQVDSEAFHRDIVPAGEPALIRSLFKDWPAVTACQASAEAACHYLEDRYNGTPVYTIAAAPDARGRFFYSKDLQGVNFRRGQVPLTQVLAQLTDCAGPATSHSIAVQALSVRDVLPDFEEENPVELLDASVAPTMWIGNKGYVAPHYDVHRNLACVVAGRRQFILFPPDQVRNLYPGPVLGAPGGVPISLVDAWDPDFDRFPRYRGAQEVAQEAVLEPGDALYIPALWWHGVASLDPVNILVNYWWGGIGASGISPNDTLLHGMLTIAKLDETQRHAWRDYFDYFVFRSGEDPAAHLPGDIRDIITSLTPEQAIAVKEFLSQHLTRN